jgi:hypothetical protein
MIEGGYPGGKNMNPIATACVRAMEPMLDHLDQAFQLSILAAVEGVIHELLGRSAHVENAKPGDAYTQPARGPKDFYQDPEVQKEITKFVKDNGGDPGELLPW